MKAINLAKTTGLLSVISGIIMLLSTIIFWIIVFSSLLEENSEELNDTISTIMGAFLIIGGGTFFFISVILFILGILSLNYYKNTTLFSPSAPFLIIIGGIIGLIPFIGTLISSICAVIGGMQYLIGIKTLKRVQEKDPSLPF